MTITVYFGEQRNRFVNEPQSVHRDFVISQKKAKKNDDNTYLQDIHLCPSVQKYYSNTFSIASEFGWTVNWEPENNMFISYDMNQEQFNKHFLPRNAKSGFISALIPELLIIPDKSVEVEILPSTLTNTNFNKDIRCISGAFNPYKHIRKMELAFIINEPNKRVEYKAGDDLFYIRFNTDEKIIFKRFFCTNEVVETVNNHIANRSLDNRILPMKWWYEASAKLGIRKRIMKEIENNLC